MRASVLISMVAVEERVFYVRAGAAMPTMLAAKQAKLQLILSLMICL